MNKHAQALGRLGGKKGGQSRSEKKIAASRLNGSRGGRPKKFTPQDILNWYNDCMAFHAHLHNPFTPQGAESLPVNNHNNILTPNETIAKLTPE